LLTAGGDADQSREVYVLDGQRGQDIARTRTRGIVELAD
jgi:hypothetical protein